MDEEKQKWDLEQTQRLLDLSIKLEEEQGLALSRYKTFFKSQIFYYNKSKHVVLWFDIL